MLLESSWRGETAGPILPLPGSAVLNLSVVNPCHDLWAEAERAGTGLMAQAVGGCF